MDFNTDGDKLEYKFAGDLIRTTDPKELEANRLAVIAQEAEDCRLAEIEWDERDRDIKEWKAANPESKTHPWMMPGEWARATNAPCGWGNDYYRLKEVLAISEDQYRSLAQKAMDAGGNPAYAEFTADMYAIANAEGKRLFGLGFKVIVSPSCLAKAQDKRSNEGGVK
jgi:hypothetical protein